MVFFFMGLALFFFLYQCVFHRNEALYLLLPRTDRHIAVQERMKQNTTRILPTTVATVSLAGRIQYGGIPQGPSANVPDLIFAKTFFFRSIFLSIAFTHITLISLPSPLQIKT